MAAKGSSGNMIGFVFFGLFSLPFALGGLFIDGMVLKTGCDDLRMSVWGEVPCDIVSAELKEERSNDSTTYRVVAQYRYKVDGVEHVGRRVTLIDGGDNIGSFHHRIFAELDEHRVAGQPFRCFVNPGNPDEAVLYRDARWEQLTLLTVAGILFSAVGFGLLGVTLYAWLDRRSASPVPSADASQPWLSRADWAAGTIRHSGRRTADILRWFGWAILIISTPSLLASLSEILLRGNALAALGLIPSGIAALLLVASRRRMASWRRYGDSTFQMAAVPGVVGGKLAGVIRTEGPVDSPDGFDLRLYCTETERSSRNSDEGNTSRVVWQHTITIERAMHTTADDGTAIPVLFHLPYDVPQTATDPSTDTLTWRLSVKSLVPKGDYRAEFEVPVFRTKDSDPFYKPDDSAIAAFQQAPHPAHPADPDALLKRAGLRVEPLPGDGIRLIFPRCRNLGSTAGLTVLQTIFTASIVAACWHFWPAGWPYVGAFFAYAWFHSILDMLFYRSQVEVTSTNLLVTRGILSLWGPSEILAEEFAKAVSKTPDSAGSSTDSQGAANLFAELTSGKNVLLAKRIYPNAAAENVAWRINRVLKAGRK